jgi:hypothetical protein
VLLCAALLAAGLAGLAVAPPPPAAHAQAPVPLDAFATGVETKGAGRAVRGPRLFVCLILDQYRDDYLDRFRPWLGHDGLLRLVDGGARFRDCTIPYALTVTAAGHATWLSGAPPRATGIPGNDWIDAVTGESVNAVRDPRFRAVGAPGEGSSASPLRMRAEVVPDMLRESTRGAARVVSISGKDRGAVLPAGRRPNGAYWYDPASGRFQTSSYYMDALPAWAVEANQRMVALLEDARRTPWTRLLPEGAYLGTVSGDPADAFPHPLVAAAEEDDGKATPGAVGPATHPVSLEATFAFAEAAVAGEGLGADDVPDLLVLSVSVPDAVGHRYGPDSPEVLDLAVRTDRRLAAFLRFLDRTVGRGRYTVSLTSDHGVQPNAAAARAFRAAPQDSVGGWPGAAIRGWIDRVLTGAAGARAQGLRGFARGVGYGVITFDDSVLAAAGVTAGAAARVLADSAGANPWLATAFTGDDVRAGRIPGDLGRRETTGWYDGRRADAFLVPRPLVVFGATGKGGASHGTPWRDDTHVPLVFWGWGVRPGTTWRPVTTLDLAPTVSALLGIDAPSQSEGRVLDEALDLPRAAAR